MAESEEQNEMTENSTNPQKAEDDRPKVITADDTSDPVIIESFNDIKAAILSNRVDIVRYILSTAQSLREDDLYDSEGEERDAKELTDKYDSREYVDLLTLLLFHQDTDSGTLLHHATRHGSADIIRALLSVGADVLVKNTEGKNPYKYCTTDAVNNAYVGDLLSAVSQSRTHRVKQLLACGIGVNSTDGAISQNSILHWAASYADVDTLQILLDNNADVDLCNADGQTPLHDAVKRKEKIIVEKYLQYNPDVHIKPHKGSLAGVSPYELASKTPLLLPLFQHYLDSKQNGHHVQDENKKPAKLVPSCPRTPEVIPVDRLAQHLCPRPRLMKQFKGLFFVPSQQLNFLVSTKKDTTRVTEIIDLFEDRLEKLGHKLSIQMENNCEADPFCKQIECRVDKRRLLRREEYCLKILSEKVSIVARDTKALYRALSTLVQCFQLFSGKAVPLFQICDWTDKKHRGVLLDFLDNDIPNIEILKETIDLLSYFKSNQVQISVEHIQSKLTLGNISPSEFLDLQVFCWKRCVKVVPYIDFNRLPQLLSKEEDNKKEELDISYLQQLLAPFIYTKYIHVDVGDLEVLNALECFCGDEVTLQVSSSTPLNNSFLYTKKVDKEEDNNTINDLGLRYVISFEVLAANRVLSGIEVVELNDIECNGVIACMKCSGQQLCSFTTSISPFVINASRAWNCNHKLPVDYACTAVDYFIFEDSQDGSGSMLNALSASSLLTDGRCLVNTFLNDNFTNHSLFQQQNIVVALCKQLKKAKTYFQTSKLSSSLSEMIIEEIGMLSDLVYFICRVIFGIINLREKVESPTIDDLPYTQRSDNSNMLILLIKRFEEFYTKYYSNSTHATNSRSLELLNALLQNLLPPSTPSIMMGAIHI